MPKYEVILYWSVADQAFIAEVPTFKGSRPEILDNNVITDPHQIPDDLLAFGIAQIAGDCIFVARLLKPEQRNSFSLLAKRTH